MGLSLVTAGQNLPHDINVIIEIPAHSEPIKYEVDKKTGALFVDRFLSTCMHYPCDYGYIPKTLSSDGDPVDVLVITPIPVNRGSVIRCRPIGMLMMEDEAGHDQKILAVPTSKLTKLYEHVHKPEDLPALLLKQIAHFFTHYKDLETDKWVKLEGWAGREAAEQVILESIKSYQATEIKPPF
ncbi:inorganic diphosphatase [Candidatus Berkiella cookevillensis]|uniref:Inorganic pyrophosphatase n=1 Tax=Candidatus Berkiella cookevillensis TaxID=437022 RepID=A0A0Q9YF28_9GAMM|nr:inorganic diphosphatase [Candidatus Berkiella cookevillensis]MCS5709459.1 inorganic diphosphatase [Candidatus Berkiella cookevillensis]